MPTKFESLHEHCGNIAMTLVLVPVPRHPRSIRILVSIYVVTYIGDTTVGKV